jgi:hypothetical protein
MEVILIMWAISAGLIVFTILFENYIEKLDESRPLKKWWKRHVIGDFTEHID